MSKDSWQRGEKMEKDLDIEASDFHLPVNLLACDCLALPPFI